MSVETIGALAERLREALGRAVVGQRRAIDEILAALLTGGHVLLEGPPGVGKTLIAQTLAHALGADFRRVQFTPDLMPADVVGARVFDFQKGEFRLSRGPVFTRVLLADEINRAPPKTQAALLEAMQERQVTIDGETHPLPSPFFVIATQNPLEMEGTYPLPEAQLDRFLMKVRLGYPAPEDELQIYARFLAGQLALQSSPPQGPPAIRLAALAAAGEALAGVHVEDKVQRYLLSLVEATRRDPRLDHGASPRAGLALLAAARTWAALAGRAFVIPDDIKRLADPVLRHRLVPTPEAELDGRGADRILAALIDGLEIPR